VCPAPSWFVLVTLATAGCSLEHRGLAGGAVVPPPLAPGPPAEDAAPAADAASALPPAPPAPIVAPAVDAAPTDPRDAAPAADSLTPDAPPADRGPVEDPADTCPDRPALVLCLRFERLVLDESPAQIPVAPAFVAFADGPSGTASDLGPNSEITLADNALFYGPAVTIEAAVEPRPPGHDAVIVEHQGQYSLKILADGTAVCLGGATASRPGAAPAGVWTSLACTFGGGTVALWVDGVKAAESARAAPLPNPAASRLTVGWGDPPGSSFQGMLDDVRLWRQVRTPAQICSGALTCH
jgi:hypothetical protein